MKKNLVLLFILFSVASLTVAAETPISTVIECDANGNSLHLGTPYTVRGIVTTPNLHAVNLSFYIQDATGGLDIFTFSNAAWYSGRALAIGSDVTVVGTVDFYRGVVELVPALETDIVVNGTGTIPTPQIITMDDLQPLTGDNQARFNLRGKLAKIMNTYHATGGVAWPTSVYANFTIAIGSAAGTPTGNCYINPATNIIGNPEPTWPQNITGIFNQYDTASPYWEIFEISPRMYTDFETFTTVGDWELY